jgi:AbrB family looped-hinge helix DNA binding protein
MPIVRTSPKGQVVVPAELREVIGLNPGDLVLVSHAGGRQVLIEPVAEDPISAVRGLLKEGPSLTTALTEEHSAEQAREAEKSARLLRHPGSSE